MEKSTKKYDDPRVRNLTTRIFGTEADLERTKKTMSAVNLQTLPDKGAKLKGKVEELEKLLETLTLEAKAVLEEGQVCASNDNAAKSSKDKFPDKDKNKFSDVPVTNTREFAHKPKISGKQMHPTSNTEKQVHLPSKKVDQTKIVGLFDMFSKDGLSGMSSFADLNKTAAETDPVFDNFNSPSFKTYRQPDKVPSIKLTDAKPLYEPWVTGKQQKTIYTACYPDAMVNEETVKQLHGSLCTLPENITEESEPVSLKTCLMKHQIEALTWLVWREAQQPSGGILADDMGLGKTLTVISLILKQKQEKNFMSEKTGDNSRGTLIVCLASIIHQWKLEIEKHCEEGSLKVLVYHGPKRERSVDEMRKYDVVVTTYSILLSERKALINKKVNTGLFELKWERVVLDEAHTIKNYSSQTAEAVFALKSFRRWCVTGTPIHNEFKDMYSLVKFLRFSPFDDYKKWKKLTSEDTAASNDRRNLLVKSILLRRTKEEADESGKQLIEMVGKSMSICYLDLSEQEMGVYDELNSKVMNKLLDKNVEKIKRSALLVLLLRLQQCCGHLWLLGKDEEEDNDNDSLSELSMCLTALNIKEQSAASESCSESSLDLSLGKFQQNDLSDRNVKSTKIQKLFDMLKDISEKSGNTEKSVVVSQWVSMLEIVKLHLQKDGIGYHMISGDTKAEDRQKVSEDFNYNANGPKVMLLSLKAGGVGLNLVGGNHLFLLDLHWNPALERQACDRIHRVGQTKEVTIHKFICKNTIEERIFELQNDKSNRASEALHGGGKVTKGLSMEDFRSLFNVRL